MELKLKGKRAWVFAESADRHINKLFLEQVSVYNVRDVI